MIANGSPLGVEYYQQAPSLARTLRYKGKRASHFDIGNEVCCFPLATVSEPVRLCPIAVVKYAQPRSAPFETPPPPFAPFLPPFSLSLSLCCLPPCLVRVLPPLRASFSAFSVGVLPFLASDKKGSEGRDCISSSQASCRPYQTAQYSTVQSV